MLMKSRTLWAGGHVPGGKQASTPQRLLLEARTYRLKESRFLLGLWDEGAPAHNGSTGLVALSYSCVRVCVYVLPYKNEDEHDVIFRAGIMKRE